MKHIGLVFIAIVFVCGNVSCAMNNSRLTSASEIQRTLLRDYNRADPPPGGPTVVSIGIYVHSFYDVDERNMQFSMGIYLREQWVDSRLAYGNTEMGRVKLEDGAWDRLWVPDVYLRNGKTVDFHDVTTPNRFIVLHSNGEVWYASKISMTLSCPMDLQRFPLDTQECQMLFESFGYTAGNIVFQWLDNPVEFDTDIHLPTYELVDVQTSDCTKDFVTGVFPCLKITYKLERELGYYLIQLYLPSALVVILSWIAFWSTHHAGLERINIGLLAILTVTTHSSSFRDHLPRVSYITAMDVWMFVCLLFAGASLVESAAVNAMLRKKEYMAFSRMSKKIHNPEKSRTPANTPATAKSNTGWTSDESMSIQDEDAKARRAEFIDKVSRIAFPVAFFLFCTVYWIAFSLL